MRKMVIKRRKKITATSKTTPCDRCPAIMKRAEAKQCKVCGGTFCASCIGKHED